jgi:hypothetical protein
MYMPNEFEKIVQQKMDELNLVPSEPVWQKVEMQIRKKKDRRRLIFWIPLLGLLLGGGLWIGLSQYSNKVSYNKSNSLTHKTNDRAIDQKSLTTETDITTKHLDKKSSENIKTIINNNTIESEKIKESPEIKNRHIGFVNKPGVQKNISQKINETTEKTLNNKKEIPEKSEETNLNTIANNLVVSQSSIEKKLSETTANPDTVLRTDSIVTTITDNEKKVEPILTVQDSVKYDSASVKDSIQKQDTAVVKKIEPKKYAASKWKLNLVVTAGSSNITDVNLFSGVFGGGEKSLAAPNYSGGSQSGGATIYYGPSNFKEGFSFALGAVAKKQLAKRTFFSTGLQYNYYSNTIQVGNRINQGRIFMDVAVSQYYSNTGTVLQPYKNQYHFVSLPVTMDFQLLRKLPLNFHAGFSMQYLIQTNGLVFDYSAQSYFNSKAAFNRVQLFFEPGLTYSVKLQQKLLTFGPQLQYGLSSLEKNNSDHHLFSYGLKAQLQLGKK